MFATFILNLNTTSMAAAYVQSGIWTTVWKKKKASTAFVKNQLVDLVSGFVQPSTSSTVNIFGVNQDNDVDSGSATTTKIPVLVPRSSGVLRITATGTLASTDEGTAFDMSDSQTVNKAATTYKCVRCLTYLSATEGLFTLNFPAVN